MADDVQDKAAEQKTEAQTSDFEKQAAEAAPGLVAEFLDFLVHNKKWWLTPIIIVLLLVGLLVMLSGSVVAPFIYPIF